MVTTMLIVMVLISGKIVHNMIRIERIHKGIKVIIKENEKLLIKNI